MAGPLEGLGGSKVDFETFKKDKTPETGFNPAVITPEKIDKTDKTGDVKGKKDETPKVDKDEFSKKGPEVAASVGLGVQSTAKTDVGDAFAKASGNSVVNKDTEKSFISKALEFFGFEKASTGTKSTEEVGKAKDDTSTSKAGQRAEQTRDNQPVKVEAVKPDAKTADNKPSSSVTSLLSELKSAFASVIAAFKSGVEVSPDASSKTKAKEYAEDPAKAQVSALREEKGKVDTKITELGALKGPEKEKATEKLGALQKESAELGKGIAKIEETGKPLDVKSSRVVEAVADKLELKAKEPDNKAKNPAVEDAGKGLEAFNKAKPEVQAQRPEAQKVETPKPEVFVKEAKVEVTKVEKVDAKKDEKQDEQSSQRFSRFVEQALRADLNSPDKTVSTIAKDVAKNVLGLGDKDIEKLTAPTEKGSAKDKEKENVKELAGVKQ